MALDQLPAGYGERVAQIKTQVGGARLQAVCAANEALVALYLWVGQLILTRQAAPRWDGARLHLGGS